MRIKVYKKDKGTLSPKMFEDYKSSLFSVISDIDSIIEVTMSGMATDWDLMRSGELVHRFNQNDFYLMVEM